MQNDNWFQTTLKRNLSIKQVVRSQNITIFRGSKKGNDRCELQRRLNVFTRVAKVHDAGDSSLRHGESQRKHFGEDSHGVGNVDDLGKGRDRDKEEEVRSE